MALVALLVVAIIALAAVIRRQAVAISRLSEKVSAILDESRDTKHAMHARIHGLHSVLTMHRQESAAFEAECFLRRNADRTKDSSETIVAELFLGLEEGTPEFDAVVNRLEARRDKDAATLWGDK